MSEQQVDFILTELNFLVLCSDAMLITKEVSTFLKRPTTASNEDLVPTVREFVAGLQMYLFIRPDLEDSPLNPSKFNEMCRDTRYTQGLNEMPKLVRQVKFCVIKFLEQLISSSSDTSTIEYLATYDAQATAFRGLAEGIEDALYEFMEEDEEDPLTQGLSALSLGKNT